MATSPFDHISSISHSKKNLMKEAEDPTIAEKEYVPFVVNRGLSYFNDTILFAQEVNKLHFLDNKMQYEFLLNCPIRSKKRFSKWFKAEQNPLVELVMEYYKYSRKKAESVVDILTPDQIMLIKDSMRTGGTTPNEKEP